MSALAEQPFDRERKREDSRDVGDDLAPLDGVSGVAVVGRSFVTRRHGASVKDYSVEWRGTITRDVGWKVVTAADEKAAREKFIKEYGGFREVVAISLITGERARAPQWRQ